jgi:hypothetical protein
MKAAAGSGQVAGRLVLAVLAPLLFVAAGAAQESALPDADALFAAARDNLTRSNRVQNQFAYKERRTQLHMNPFGRVGTGGTIVYDVTPLVPGPGFTRQLLEREGKPVANAEVETFGLGGRRRDRSQSPEAVQDIVATLDFAIDRRVSLDGKPAVVVSFKPKPAARPVTREGKMARSFAGKIWIDEAATEVRRVEATAVESISYGYGLIARLGEGTVVTLRREPIDGDVWLPISIRFKGQGRALLLRKLHVDFGIDWFDYRKIAR